MPSALSNCYSVTFQWQKRSAYEPKFYLEHGGETSTAGNHTNGAAHVGGVAELALGSTSIDRITDRKFAKHLGDVSLRVGLDAPEARRIGLLVNTLSL